MADLRQAMQYAGQNPNSDFAKQLKLYIEMGKADEEAAKSGINLAPFGRSAPVQQTPVIPEGRTGFTTPSPEAVEQRKKQLSGGLDTVFGGGKLGEALGGSIAGIGELAKGNVEGAMNIGASQPKALEVGGDLLRMITTVGSLALGGVATGSAIGGAQALGLGRFAPLAGKVAVGAGTGYAFDVGEGLKKGEGVESLKPGVGTAVGAAIPILSEGIGALGRLIKGTGEKIQNVVLRPTSPDLKDGFNIDTVNKYNLGGSLKSTFKKTDTLMDDLSRQLNERLADSKALVNMNEVYKKTADRVIGQQVESFGSNTAMERALGDLQQEVSTVADNVGNLSVPSANVVKRASGHYGAWLYGNVDPDANAKQRVYNVFYNEIKKAIEQAAPEVQDINKKLSELIPVMNAIIRRIPVAERNAAISLPDIITLSAASLEPKTFLLFLANQASKSGNVGAFLAKFGNLLNQPGPVKQGIEKVSQTLAPAVTSQLDSTGLE